MESTLNRPTRCTAGLSLDTTVVYQTLVGTGKVVAEITEGAASFLEHISTTGVNNLITTTDYLVSGPLQLILNLLLILAVLAVLLLIGYLIFGRYISTHFGRCFPLLRRTTEQEQVVHFSDLQEQELVEHAEDLQSQPASPEPNHFIKMD
uniref:Uncharacterized protein n=1 Tax=Romanomermis culicivorax TaxID=13658 RepID=A0A915KT05_ROMCU